MQIPDLSPHHLASLVAIADQGSISAAARSRGLTQPSITRQIQDLERQLATELIERTPQGARLTPAGDLLAEGARELLSGLAALPHRVQQSRGEVSGSVRLGTVSSLAIYVLPALLVHFQQSHPHIRLELVCESSPQLTAMLLADELDVAVATIEHPKLASERLYQDRLVIIHSPSLPAAQRPRSLADLSVARVVTFSSGLTVRTLIDDAFRRAGLSFRPVMELAHVEVIKAMVRSGLGLGIIPDGCVQNSDLDTTVLHDLIAARTIRLLSRPHGGSRARDQLMTWLRRLRRP